MKKKKTFADILLVKPPRPPFTSGPLTATWQRYTAQILSPHTGSAVQDTTWDTAKTQQGQAALAFN